jgi:hypothetical protein
LLGGAVEWHVGPSSCFILGLFSAGRKTAAARRHADRPPGGGATNIGRLFGTV